MSALERPHFWKCSDLQKCAVSSFCLLRQRGYTPAEAFPACRGHTGPGGWGRAHAGFAARELNAKQFGWRQNRGPTCLTLKRTEETGAGAVSPASSPTCSESLIYLGVHVRLAKGVTQRDQGQKHGSSLVLHQGKCFMAVSLEENAALVHVYVDGVNHCQPVPQ